MPRNSSSTENIYFGSLKGTPLGEIWLATTEKGLAAVHWAKNQSSFEAYLVNRFDRPILRNDVEISRAAKQIKEYLTGKRTAFQLEIDWSLMRPFQQKVLRITCSIPYGETRTYSDIAHQLGNPRAARAVGHAQATNPLPLIVPCHRVIGVDGKLHGYGAGKGLPTKEWLLLKEGAVMA